jgi:signal peptidase II
MGIPTGELGLLALVGLSVVMVAALTFYWWRLSPSARIRPIGLALVVGGALGNLRDRVFSQRGVVDFIDLGVGSLRFWTFNLADAAITAGAVLLAWWMWKHDRAMARREGAPERS